MRRVTPTPETQETPSNAYPSKALAVLGVSALSVVAFVLVFTLGTRERPVSASPTPSPTVADSTPAGSDQGLAPESVRPGTTDEILRDGETEAIGSVQALRRLPQAQLVANLRGGKPLIRVASLTILWERGQRDLVREQAAGEPLLEAQLRALEARKPR